METIRLQDKYDSRKVWVIKRSACRHYYINQEINGKQFYKKFTRVTRRYIEQLFADGNGFYLAQLVQPEAHFVESYTEKTGKKVTVNRFFDNDKDFFAYTDSLGSVYVRATHTTFRFGNFARDTMNEMRLIRA